MHVLTALKFLRHRCRGWGPLAKALHFNDTTIANAANGRVVTPTLAFRVARLGGVSVDDVHRRAVPGAGHVPPLRALRGARVKSVMRSTIKYALEMFPRGRLPVVSSLRPPRRSCRSRRRRSGCNGYRCHGYWQSNVRLGLVWLLPPGFPVVYTWSIPRDYRLGGTFRTLRAAKRAVERATARKAGVT